MELKDKRQELQRILAEMETYRRQMDSIKNEIQLLESTLVESRSSILALDGLKKNKKGTEIFVSIGSGSFIKAKLEDVEKVTVGVGAGISIEKKVDEAKTILESRSEEIKKAIEKLQKSAVDINNQIVRLNEESQILMRDIQAGQV